MSRQYEANVQMCPSLDIYARNHICELSQNGFEILGIQCNHDGYLRWSNNLKLIFTEVHCTETLVSSFFF